MEILDLLRHMTMILGEFGGVHLQRLGKRNVLCDPDMFSASHSGRFSNYGRVLVLYVMYC